MNTNIEKTDGTLHLLSAEYLTPNVIAQQLCGEFTGITEQSIVRRLQSSSEAALVRVIHYATKQESVSAAIDMEKATKNYLSACELVLDDRFTPRHRFPVEASQHVLDVLVAEYLKLDDRQIKMLLISNNSVFKRVGSEIRKRMIIKEAQMLGLTALTSQYT